MGGKSGGKIVEKRNGHGESHFFHLRPYKEGDEAGMIACIWDEYGETYFKRELYDPRYLKKEAKEDRITFLVAETEKGEIAGMMMLKQLEPQESMCEIASQIFRKKYRGYGLAISFFEYGMEILLSRSCSAAFCLPVMFHSVTQRLLYRLGMRATGMVLNVFDMKQITHSYRNGRNTKHSQGIQIRAAGKLDAGSLFLPVEHQGFARRIYESLGVDYHLMEETAKKKKMPKCSGITVKNDSIQHSLTICIQTVGEDLKKRILQTHIRFPLKDRQTAGIFLNCNDENAVWAYDILCQMGYFFTGLKPLCSEREYLVLHHSGKIRIYFEDYQASEEFAEIIRYVKTCYEKRKNQEEMICLL